MRYIIIAIVVLLGLSISACKYFKSEPDDEKIVARVYDSYLLMSELESVIEPEVSPQDSATIAQRYIDSWIKQQIFLAEAKNNLEPEKMNFDKKIQDYKNSLIIFTFETEYINNNLDTVINDEQISEYYENNKSDFKLKENIVMASYVKVSLDVEDQNTVRKLIRSDDPEDRDKLEEYCVQNAAGYFLDNKSWLLFNDILRNIPIDVHNQDNFLRNNKMIEISDDFYRYFLYINDYMLEDNVSPLAFEEKNIRNILINKRKHKLINDFRAKLYKDALRDNNFEVFP
ncbi:MAG: hypothetical protein ACOCWC_03265 [Bacteroidota bacterium]